MLPPNDQPRAPKKAKYGIRENQSGAAGKNDSSHCGESAGNHGASFMSVVAANAQPIARASAVPTNKANRDGVAEVISPGGIESDAIAFMISSGDFGVDLFEPRFRTGFCFGTKSREIERLAENDGDFLRAWKFMTLTECFIGAKDSDRDNRARRI